MNPSTASHRLLRDILWSLVVKTNQHFCCKCGEEMSRQTFSIEHIIPWLNSENPVELFFDLKNISFSHLKCNISDIRPNKKYASKEEAYQARLKSARNWKKKNRVYLSAKRRERYLKFKN